MTYEEIAEKSAKEIFYDLICRGCFNREVRLMEKLVQEDMIKAWEEIIFNNM